MTDVHSAIHPAAPNITPAEAINLLEKWAQQCATDQKVDTRPDSQLRLLNLLNKLSNILREAYRYFVATSEEELALSYAAEWLLDNFHIIEQALRQVKEDLPVGYYRQLPKLDQPQALKGYPRVYALARTFIEFEECQFNLERFKQFVVAYQQAAPLTMGEVWALPIMLRLTLLEMLAQAASRIAKLTVLSPTDEDAPAFESNLGDNDIVASCIPCLRQIESVEWKKFFEDVNLVQQILKQDPIGIYAQMDFDTRNRYRSVVEKLARATSQAAPQKPASMAMDLAKAEVGIAQNAIDLAQAAYATGRSTNGRQEAQQVKKSNGISPWANLQRARDNHVGYYLIAEGRTLLEKQIGYQSDRFERPRRWLLAHPTLVYLGGVVLLTLLIVLAVTSYAIYAEGSGLLILLAAILTLVPAVTSAVNLLNWLVTHLLPPRVLPKLDFEEGMPAECRTMVVVPALLANHADVETLLAQLELHYLRNPDPQLTFALLADFVDAAQQQLPADEDLLDKARAQVEALNRKYPHQPFYYFHRQRLWNPSENVWMGWERKRGKLHEFNKLLRNSPNTSFNLQIGNLEILPKIKYVITLDADTVLPRDGAHRLVGALAHPLNQARFVNNTQQISAGYTVLQPRTIIKPSSANHSLFTRVFAGDAGLDLYTMAVSDVYQDLFGAGIYVGKGIYDVDAFERSLVGRAPENTLLSHDLFEGIHGRVGLVSDVVLYENYPPHYLINVLRSHRWVRGDWQLLPWLLQDLRLWLNNFHSEGAKEIATRSQNSPSAVELIDRWKIIDNLRRSLLSPALLVLFVAGWTLLPGSAFFWTALGLVTPAFSLIIGALTGLVHSLRSKKDVNQGGSAWRAVIKSLRDNALRWLLYLAFLPYETLVLLDAIFITLGRVFFTRRNLLQWTTAEHTVRLFGDEVKTTTTLLKMLPSIVLTIGLAVLVVVVRPSALPVAVPFFVTWLFAWQIAYWISQPDSEPSKSITAEQQRELRILARRTWLFYEQFVGPDDNWLPPDHFQESPRGVVAHRTSPTNIGMYLLSMLAAHDLGYMIHTNLALRLHFTFDTLEKLDRYRGHFLNWIDTRTLEPLSPRYVSTVDSGNLAGCLIALRQGCLEMPQQPVWRSEWWPGTLDLLASLGATVAASGQPSEPSTAPLLAVITKIEEQVATVAEDPSQWYKTLTHLAGESRQELDGRLIDFIEAHAAHLNIETIRDYRIYSDRVHARLDNMQREVDQFLPWLAYLAQPPALFTELDNPVDAPNTEILATLRETWQTLQATFPLTPRLVEVTELCVAGQTHIERLQRLLGQLAHDSSASSPAAPNNALHAESIQAARVWCTALLAHLKDTPNRIESLLDSFADLAEQAETLITDMEFGFLFDEYRQVFHIGYNIDAGLLDNSYYDLLASEARIASLIAIGKDDVPQSHWLHLGRPLTRVENGEQVLLSWSGTMFEYLMPPLLLRTYPGTLQHQSYYSCIDHQIEYGKQKGVPWGISESGFYAFDAAMNYQYYAFGVPGLGFKRGLADALVITPYASMLALPFRPQAVLKNMEQLKNLGMMGRYGFYEAIDFTAARLSLGQDKAIVRSYMAHHQGMIMLAVAEALQGARMVDRFHADPRIESVDLLLQEQVPQGAPLLYPHEEESTPVRPAAPAVVMNPWPVPTDSPMPLVHFLSNGNYGVLITNAGGGYSQWKDIALTRWRADTTLDDWGCWLYIQDKVSGALWSPTRQPTGNRSEHEEVLFHPHMVEFRRRDNAISQHVEIIVSPDDDVEIRRINLTNDSDEVRQLQLTSYGEIVLAPAAGDRRHQAFAKLFVESEYLPEINALIFRRRPRSADEDPHFLLHMLIVETEGAETAEQGTYESDRARFLGRGHTPRDPQALQQGHTLSNTTGATLDPVMALSHDIHLMPRTTRRMTFLTIVAATRPDSIILARRYQVNATIDRMLTRARSQAERELRQLDLDSTKLAPIQQMLSLLLYPHPARRADPAILMTNRKGQSSLWAFGISGDYPILLMRIRDESEGELLQELLQAHTYWRRRGLQIDLVILNQQASNYGQSVQGFIQRMIQRMDATALLNQRGGIFVLYEDQLNEGDRVLLQTAARVILDGHKGQLTQQLDNLLQRPMRLPAFVPMVDAHETPDKTPPLVRPADLQFDNAAGGFSADGSEYVIYLRPGETTPAPWINVIANPDFGFLVSETGGGYTWSINSGENRITTWRNDPVSDMPAEVIYVRDEETAEIWSPTPQPAPTNQPYLVRHGAGYTQFEHNSHNLNHQLRLFVAPDGVAQGMASAPVKIAHLRLENVDERPRRLTITYYADWVLGVDRDSTQQYLAPEFEESCGCLLVRNAYSAEFGQRVAFLAASKELHGLTTDRTEFLGRLGDIRRPAALERVGLAGRLEAGIDSCGVLQLHVDLAPGASEEVYFLIGQGANREQALALVEQFKKPEIISAAWQATQDQWKNILGTLTVKTPDPAMDLLLNQWLLYQALACRTWGRSALYQSSGAFGFRDQLQDVMALIHARPDLTRQHILETARHQFEAGDVLHWWHPPAGRGVRTRISDDLLWLPYVTANYVAATGDTGILNETMPFLRGEPLREDEEERYSLYDSTEAVYSLYEHCRRALRKGTTAGSHGIPLMGAGDWNDGMNRVGIQGKGESIWLGWFLNATLNDFASLCENTGKQDHATTYRQQAETIRQALEQNGWDGQWYRRAYYDDGTPLGSAQNRECQIDSIAQSWSVLSHAGEPARAKQAMQAVSNRLVKQDGRLILLFTPPFDKTTKDPGYIKGYLPGIRENGGQYTHAALWTIWAFASMGDGEQAEALFRLINPIYRADSAEKSETYKVEPYVIAADVYGVPPHVGRGGWTWYTGSAGWMYRLGIEAILGVHRMFDHLRIDPCIPQQWPGYTVVYRNGQTTYQIQIDNSAGVNRGVKQVLIDGLVAADGRIQLYDDGKTYQVVVEMG
ncbi:hypothetical protein BH10CHL1_BH10CHL1_00970 [soil metagenome]